MGRSLLFSRIEIELFDFMMQNGVYYMQRIAAEGVALSTFKSAPKSLRAAKCCLLEDLLVEIGLH